MKRGEEMKKEEEPLAFDVSITELAQMYKKAVSVSDRNLAAVAEAAAFHVADAEAARQRVDVLRHFLFRAGV